MTNSAARTVVARTKDPEAVEDAIAAVNGLDALFIGRVDLTVGYGATSLDNPRVLVAVEAVCAAGVRAGRPVGTFPSRIADVPHWRAKGATLFFLGLDHGSCSAVPSPSSAT